MMPKEAIELVEKFYSKYNNVLKQKELQRNKREWQL
jgi:hypothetical protein